MPDLVEIFEPPMMQVVGFFALSVNILITFTSSKSCLPAKELICFVISWTEAWVLWEHGNASFIYISPIFESSLAKDTEFNSSSLWKRMFSKSMIYPLGIFFEFWITTVPILSFKNITSWLR